MTVGLRLRDLIWSPATKLYETGLRRGMVVLDFGCGPGSFALAAARLVGPEGRVYACDAHSLAIESVQRAAARRGMKNIQAVLGTSLGELPAGSIDVVLLYDVLHELADPKLVLAEIHRILRPTGFLSVSDHCLRKQEMCDEITAGGLFQLAKRCRWTHTFRRAEPIEETR